MVSRLTTPVVLVAYNRPDKFGLLLSALRSQGVEDIIVCLDGPKPSLPEDARRVNEVHRLATEINWTNRLEVRTNDSNVGLRENVVSSVNYATQKYGRAIVIEDDVIPGPLMIPFLTSMLNQHEGDRTIEHVSGFNLVPPEHHAISGLGPRLSRYPESYAWATWERAWTGYDHGLTWALNATMSDIQKIVGTRMGALRWKQNFLDAASGRISTWAYRWISSMWSRDSFTISPGANLAQYGGHNDGTHTFLRPKWEHVPIYEGEISPLLTGFPEFDSLADRWLAQTVFDENAFGVSRGVGISAVLELRKHWSRLKR